MIYHVDLGNVVMLQLCIDIFLCFRVCMNRDSLPHGMVAIGRQRVSFLHRAIELLKGHRLGEYVSCLLNK